MGLFFALCESARLSGSTFAVYNWMYQGIFCAAFSYKSPYSSLSINAGNKFVSREGQRQ